MANFDPNAYLAAPSAPPAQPSGFNPDAFLNAGNASPAATKPATAKPDDGSVAGDVLKSTGIGAVEGTLGLAGLPGDIRTLASKGTDAVASYFGVSPERTQEFKNTFEQYLRSTHNPLSALSSAPTSDQITKAVESKTGEFYKPKTTAGQYGRTAGQFLPAVIGGPQSLATKLGTRVLAPAVASETAGQLTQGTALEPYARVAAAVAGPSLPSALAATTRAAASVPAKIIGGLGTHTGPRSLSTAFESGRTGGTAGEAFRENMRGLSPMEDVVSDARNALSKMRQQKSVEYQSGMTGIHNDPTVLNFGGVDSALAKANQVKNFKGVDTSKATQGVREELTKLIDEWRAFNPKEFHTPSGFDALKQAVGEVKDSLPFHSPQRLVAEQVYNGIRDTIVKQSPGYAKVMKNYEVASKQIQEIERTLSLGRKASTDTALRKLQSVMRDNVNTNYGARTKLSQSLADTGSPHLMEKLAGQANSSWTPRGLGKVVAPIVAGSSYFNPASVAMLPFMSPRLMAESSHALGRATGAVDSVVSKARSVVGLPPASQSTPALSLREQALLRSIYAVPGIRYTAQGYPYVQNEPSRGQ